MFLNCFQASSHSKPATSGTAIIIRAIRDSTLSEVGQKRNGILAQSVYQRVENLIEVVWQDLGRESNGDSFGSLGEK